MEINILVLEEFFFPRNLAEEWLLSFLLFRVSVDRLASAGWDVRPALTRWRSQWSGFQQQKARDTCSDAPPPPLASRVASTDGLTLSKSCFLVS